MKESEFDHRPVLLSETVAYLRPRPGGTYVDCTLGAGGHAEALLEAVKGEASLIGIDRDPEALQAARERLAPYLDRVSLVQGNFGNLQSLLDQRGVGEVDGVLMDLGVSSPQLDRVERGFSYWGEGPLDMRMGPDAPRTAAALLAELDADALTDVLRRFGEERFAARIARLIVKERERAPIETADELVRIVKKAVPAGARRRGGHPARRTFQALRIAVNDELGALKRGLECGVERLAPAGRIVVISFHSLEDRATKSYFSDEARGCICPPRLPVCGCGRVARLRLLTPQPITPESDEVRQNPRARSAKLRAAERIASGSQGKGD